MRGFGCKNTVFAPRSRGRPQVLKETADHICGTLGIVFKKLGIFVDAAVSDNNEEVLAKLDKIEKLLESKDVQ